MKSHLIIVAAVLALAYSSPAAPVYWFGDGTTEGGAGTWDTANNHFSASQTGPADTAWNNTTSPGDPVFEGTPGVVTISTITLNGTLTLNSDYTLLSSTITLGSSSILDMEGASTLTVSNLFAGGPLTKNGSGTLWLTGPTAQGWGNNTILNAGTIALGVGTGATLGANGTGNHLVINADGVTFAQRSSAGRSPQAAVDQLGDLIFDNGFLGASGNVQFTLAQGNWKVNGNRKITVLAQGGAGIFLIGPPAYSSTPRIAEYSGPASWTKDGAGTLLIQAENDLTGGFTNLAGAVRPSASVNNPFGVASSALALSGGALATPGSRTLPIANPVFVTTDSTITTSATTTPIAFPFSGPLTGTVNTTLFFTGNTTAGQAFNPSLSAGFNYVGRVAVQNNGGPTTLQLFNTVGNEQTFADVISGSGALSRTSTTPGTGGNTIMTAANTYSGGTTLTDGGVGLGIDSTPGPNSGGPPLNDGPIGTGTLTVSPASGGLPMLYTYGSGREVGNAITLANNAAPLIVSNADTLTLYAPITGSGSINKQGVGQLRLSPHNGSSSYAGGTTISAGEISCDTSSSGPADAPTAGPAGTGTLTFGNGGAISALSNPRTVGNHLVFGGTSASLTGSRDLTLSGNADLGGNSVTLTVNNSASTTLSGALSNGGLAKDGPSTLVLSGTSSYAGGTTVSAGTLVVQKDGGLGSGNVTVASGAILRLTGGTANAYINSTATVTLNGASPLVTLDFTGTPNHIAALYFGAVQQPNGTWGPPLSGADHESAFFAGTGLLLVGASATPVTSFSIARGPGSSLTLSYSGGSGSRFVLLQTNNVAAPASLWTRQQTNTSSPNTFTITPGVDPEEFYRVKSE